MKRLSPKYARSVAIRAAKVAPRYFAGKLRRPFFIIGSARSGTTLLVDALRTHPDVAAYPGEANGLWHPETYPWRTSEHRDTLPPLWADPAAFTARSLELRPEDHSLRIRARFGAFQFFSGASHFLNKSAMVAFMIPHIREIFPEARFIHIIRDGRAVALSYLKKQQKKIDERPAVYQKNGHALPFEDLLDVFAGTWKRHLEEIERQAGCLKEEKRYCELTYEAFCADPVAQLRQVVSFMGLDPARLHEEALPSVRSTNYKYREKLDDELIARISETMPPTTCGAGRLPPATYRRTCRSTTRRFVATSSSGCPMTKLMKIGCVGLRNWRASTTL